MQKLIKVEEVVEQILRKDEYARNNDVYLIFFSNMLYNLFASYL